MRGLEARLAVVGDLCVAVGRCPDDPLVAELIGELNVKSPGFVVLRAGLGQR